MAHEREQQRERCAVGTSQDDVGVTRPVKHGYFEVLGIAQKLCDTYRVLRTKAHLPVAFEIGRLPRGQHTEAALLEERLLRQRRARDKAVRAWQRKEYAGLIRLRLTERDTRAVAHRRGGLQRDGQGVAAAALSRGSRSRVATAALVCRGQRNSGELYRVLELGHDAALSCVAGVCQTSTANNASLKSSPKA